MDFFAGSGTIGEVCLELGRHFILVDNNPQSIAVMQKRFSEVNSIVWVGICLTPRHKRGDDDAAARRFLD